MEKLVDTAQAVEQAGGNEQLAKELFNMLLKELPEHQQAIANAHASGDLQALWEPVHKLYGATAYCGVPALRDAAKQLEDAIRQSCWDSIAKSMQSVTQAIEALRQHGNQLVTQPW